MDDNKLLQEIRSIIKEEFAQLNAERSPEKENLTIQEASQLTRLAVATIYIKCSQKTIPHYKKGKFLYFKKSELENWIDQGKQFHYKGK